MIETIAHWCITVITASGYAGVFLLSLLENLCVPIPSEIIMPFSGYLALIGRFNLAAVILVATVANVLGSVIIYWICRTGGRTLAVRFGKYVLLTPAKLDAWDVWFKQHGPATVFWGRFVPTVRVLVTIPAGVAKMKFSSFFFYTFVGSLVWNIVLAGIGYKAGQYWNVLGTYFHKFDLVLVVVIIVAIIWWVVRHIKHT